MEPKDPLTIDTVIFMAEYFREVTENSAQPTNIIVHVCYSLKLYLCMKKKTPND